MSDTFQQARQQFLDGVRHYEAEQLMQAQACFEASLRLLPGRPSTLLNLAATYVKLSRPAEALPLLEASLAMQPHQADAWLHHGVALRALNRQDEALVSLGRAIALHPSAPAAYHRAMALASLRRHAEAVAAFELLQQLAPDDAEGWWQHGLQLQQLNRLDEALASYDRALALQPDTARAWTLRGNLLKDLGRRDEAVAAFRHALAHGGDPVLNGYCLAALTGTDVPPRPPSAYVQGLFDDYADGFDEHLVGALRYRGHHVLVEQLRAVAPGPFGSALDLGCGTGLCGPLVKPLAKALDGVDLSAAMLEKAGALGVYRQLHHADLVEHLCRTDQRYELLLAADVFIYLGALDDVFRGVQRVLAPGGWFCFSVEQAACEAGFELRESLRYAHSPHYLRQLADEHGLRVAKLHAHPIREDQKKPIAGWYAFLHKPG